jgi:mannose/fructose/N-acetylgalactosamine-specific phosphotransferase system component IID
VTTTPSPRLPVATRLSMLLRLLAVQASWNYETMNGNGLAFAIEPALRLLPGGAGGDAYRAAIARQSAYFNANPYVAAVAVGCFARAELQGDKASHIERSRTASCGPLGSVGDQLVWAGWLPLCSLLGLLAFGAGVGPLGVVLAFLVPFNAGQLALRAWALDAGWRHGLRMAEVLGHPVFRAGPQVIARATSVVAGVAIPLTVGRIVGAQPAALAAALAVALLWTVATALVARRADGWRTALIGVAAYAIFSILQ